jgi:MarR family transcriptional regulator, organic hydroperoxide resistance regulator
MPNQQQLIQSIFESGRQMSGILTCPDIDQWRQLNVPVAQLKCLFLVINHQGINSRLLADQLGVTPGNVTGIVDRLEEQNLIIRRPDPQDRRVIWIEATPKGRELLHKLMEFHFKQYAKILAYMPAEDLEALDRGLRSLLVTIQEHIDEIKQIG